MNEQPKLRENIYEDGTICAWYNKEIDEIIEYPADYTSVEAKAFKQGYLRCKNKTSAFPEQQIREQLERIFQVGYETGYFDCHDAGIRKNDLRWRQAKDNLKAVERLRELWEQK